MGLGRNHVLVYLLISAWLMTCHPTVWARTEPAVGSPRALSSVERQIVAAIDAQATDALGLLEWAVDIPSATPNLAGVRRVGDIFAAELQKLGFTTRWVSMPTEMQRAGHLFAERAGTGTEGKRLLLIGHLDVVLEGQKFRRDGVTVYGNGVDDMKDGIVVLIFALKGLIGPEPSMARDLSSRGPEMRKTSAAQATSAVAISSKPHGGARSL
jgi:hypothetical protein